MVDNVNNTINSDFLRFVINEFEGDSRIEEYIRKHRASLSTIFSSWKTEVEHKYIDPIEKEIKLKYRIYQLEEENKRLKESLKETINVIDNIPLPAVNIDIWWEKYFVENCNTRFAMKFGKGEKDNIQWYYLDQLSGIFGKKALDPSIIDEFINKWIKNMLIKRKKITLWKREKVVDISMFYVAENNICLTITDVTKQVLTERWLEATSKSFESMMNHMPVHIYTKDVEGKYLRVSKKMYEHYWFKYESDMIWKTHEELFPDEKELSDAIKKDDEQIISWERFVVSNELEFTIVNENWEKEKIWQQMTKIPTYDSDWNINWIMWASFDITPRIMATENLNRKIEEYEAVTEELKRTNKKLKSAYKNLDILDAHTNDTIYIKHADWTFKWINQAQFKRIQEEVIKNNSLYPDKQVEVPENKEACIGKLDFDFFGEHANTAKEVEDRILATGISEVTTEKFSTDKDWKTIWLQSTKSRVELKKDENWNPVYGIVWTSTDITQLMNAQEKVKENSDILDNFFAISKDSLYIKNSKLQFVRVSKSWVNTVNNSLVWSNPLPDNMNDIKWKTDADFLSPEHAKLSKKQESKIIQDAELYLATRKTLAWFPAVLLEETHPGKDWSLKYIKSVKMPFLLHGEIHIMWVSTDITDIIDKELEVLKKNEELLDQAEELQQNVEKLNSSNEELHTTNEKMRSTVEELLVTQTKLEEATKIADEARERAEEARKNEEKARKNVEQADKLKSAFLANMSHEIRTPMNGMLWFVWLIDEMVQTGDININKLEGYIEIINTSWERLLRIISDVLDISKIEAGMLDINNEDFNLDKMANNISSVYTMLVKQKVKDKNISFLFEDKLPKDFTFYWDDVRINQILTNLINNAIKFTEQWSVSLSVQLDPSEQNVLFSVKDTGIWIAKESQDLVFEAFRQEEKTTSKLYWWTWLGLAICKRLAKMMWGTIWLESEKWQWTTFFVKLPIKEGFKQIDIQVKEPKIERQNVWIDTKKKKLDVFPIISGIDAHDVELLIWNKKILIAEANEEKFESLKLTLSKCWISNIIRAKDDEDIFDVLADEAENLWLVVMDDKMPSIWDWVVATKEIRGFLTEIPIILNSFNVDDDEYIDAWLNYIIKNPNWIDEMKTFLIKYLWKSNPIIKQKYPELFK